MKKIISSIILFFVCSFMFSITLADLDFEDQLAVKDLVISLDDEITFANVEELEGTEYYILLESNYYLIVVKDGVVYIIPKD
ncbi:MAG: hypothetical protein Q7J16_02945 [Candidatus Cloacimonadales bacterium]|nr:hypothetical protein [Candidatus Cloacimonadales bacterium]